VSEQLTNIAHGDTTVGPPQEAVAGFYDDISGLMTELFGGSLHEGYWDSPDDPATMAQASTRLTDVLAAELEVGPGSTVLDIGSGTGAPAIRVARSTGADVVGITNSPVQVEQAVRSAQQAWVADRVTFRCEDATTLTSPSGSFDAVLMIESIFHLPDRLTALREVARVLRPGGRVVLTDVLERGTAVTTDVAVGNLAEHSQSQGRPALVARPVALADYPSLLAEAGLYPVEVRDITEHTVARTLACLRQRIDADYPSLIRTFGVRAVDQYRSLLPLLEAAEFGYGMVVASRPDR
jgi:cyclopropane fatty-acyl-phospholipid synthase-like methyltransferase